MPPPRLYRTHYPLGHAIPIGKNTTITSILYTDRDLDVASAKQLGWLKFRDQADQTDWTERHRGSSLTDRFISVHYCEQRKAMISRLRASLK